MPKRARERHLAKLAARRQAERAAQIRRRRRTLGAIGAVVGVAAIVGGWMFLFGGNSSTVATPSATPSTSATPAPAVACGGSVPKAATQTKPTFKSPPKMTIDTDATYTVSMQTSCGTIEMELFAKETPEAVNNFVFLADKGFYDGLTFHRIVSGFVVQGGDPQGTGTGGPGYQFKTEVNGQVKFADKGDWLAYANSGPDTNGSQFFITIGAQPNLDEGGPYTLFGEVTKGQDVVDRIAAVPTTASPGSTEQSTPTQTVYIEKVTVTEQK